MSIARVSFHRRFKDSGINGLQVNTVHDSIVCDVHEKDVIKTAELMHAVFKDLPANFKKVFGVEFNLPLLCEVQAGSNMKQLTDIEM